MTTIRPTWPWAAAGFVLSCYALYVEHKVSHKEEDESFTALCDIEQLGASCRYVLLCLMFVMCRVSVLSSNSWLNLVLFSCSLDHSPFFLVLLCIFYFILLRPDNKIIPLNTSHPHPQCPTIFLPKQKHKKQTKTKKVPSFNCPKDECCPILELFPVVTRWMYPMRRWAWCFISIGFFYDPPCRVQ
jgi:hypothetical protein